MEETKNTEKVGFALAGIATEQFATIVDNLPTGEEVNISVDFRFTVDSNERLIIVFTSFVFESFEKQFLIIESSCRFLIEPTAWDSMIDTEKKELKASQYLLQHLAVITVGTTRGILHSKTENTPFNQYFLPTMNIADLISKDSVFELSTK